MGKVLLVCVLAIMLALVLAGVALAGGTTPQDIYNDYAADGKLDGNYTDAELQAYLNDPLIDQYGNPTIVAELDALVTRLLQNDQDEFPMTGAQLALIGIGAIALVGIGVGLRRLTRSRA
jgi:hypothetical protein